MVGGSALSKDKKGTLLIEIDSFLRFYWLPSAGKSKLIF
jgi:hypothetical protein